LFGTAPDFIIPRRNHTPPGRPHLNNRTNAPLHLVALVPARSLPEPLPGNVKVSQIQPVTRRSQRAP
jgi:hypothetical protein